MASSRPQLVLDVETLQEEEPAKKRARWRQLCPQADLVDKRTTMIDGDGTDVPAGPSDAHSAVHWASDSLRMLQVLSKKHFGIDFSKHLTDIMRKGLAIRTDYSGIGTAELAAAHIAKAVEAQEDIRAKLIVQRAGDMNHRCREVLQHHSELSRPGCVHKDMLERMPERLMKRLKRLHARHLIQVKQRIGKGEKKSEVYNNQGRKFMRQAVKFVFQDNVHVSEVVAHCEVHDKDCAVLPGLPKKLKAAMVGNIAGVNCYDWSSMGAMMKWLGPSVFAFLCWARERVLARQQEQFAIVECVIGFDDEFLAEIFDGHFSLTTLRITPTMLGDPIQRHRKYMILFSDSSKLQWHPSILKFGSPQAAFEKLFARNIIMDCDERLRAPAEDIASNHKVLAVRRGMPEVRRSGRNWTGFQILTPALKTAVRFHEQVIQENEGTLKNPYVVNLHQSPNYVRTNRGVASALLRTSRLWSVNKRRLLHPLEYLELQGLNIWDNDEFQCEFASALRQLSERQVRQMAGNAMHLRVVGVAIMFCLACSQQQRSKRN